MHQKKIFLRLGEGTFLTDVLIYFLFLHKNICCGARQKGLVNVLLTRYSLETPKRVSLGGSVVCTSDW